jgi:hypothetical protein
MNIEQKVEIINQPSSADVKKRLEQQAALGWEVVSTTVNENIMGNQMVVTFKRNKNLKEYDKFVELDARVDVFRALILKELDSAIERAEKDVKRLPILGVFSVLLLFGLILLDIYIIIGSINAFKDFSFDNFLGIVFYLAISVLGHLWQRKLARKIKNSMNDNQSEDKVRIYEMEIDNIIKEAKTLDYSLNEEE